MTESFCKYFGNIFLFIDTQRFIQSKEDMWYITNVASPEPFTQLFEFTVYLPTYQVHSWKGSALK